MDSFQQVLDATNKTKQPLSSSSSLSKLKSHAEVVLGTKPSEHTLKVTDSAVLMLGVKDADLHNHTKEPKGFSSQTSIGLLVHTEIKPRSFLNLEVPTAVALAEEMEIHPRFKKCFLCCLLSSSYMCHWCPHCCFTSHATREKADEMWTKVTKMDHDDNGNLMDVSFKGAAVPMMLIPRIPQKNILKLVKGNKFVAASCILIFGTSWLQDLTMFGCVEKNPGPGELFEIDTSEGNAQIELPPGSKFNLDVPNLVDLEGGRHWSGKLYPIQITETVASKLLDNGLVFYDIEDHQFRTNKSSKLFHKIITIRLDDIKFKQIELVSSSRVSKSRVMSYIKSRDEMSDLGHLSFLQGSFDHDYFVKVSSWSLLWSVLVGPVSISAYLLHPGIYDKNQMMLHDWFAGSHLSNKWVDNALSRFRFIKTLESAQLESDFIASSFFESPAMFYPDVALRGMRIAQRLSDLLHQAALTKGKQVHSPLKLVSEVDRYILELKQIKVQCEFYYIGLKGADPLWHTSIDPEDYYDDLTVFGCVEKNPGPPAKITRQSAEMGKGDSSVTTRQASGSLLPRPSLSSMVSSTRSVVRRASTSSGSLLKIVSPNKGSKSHPEQILEDEIVPFYEHIDKMRDVGIWARIVHPVWEAQLKKMLTPHMSHVFTTLTCPIFSGNYVDTWTDFDAKLYIAESLAKALYKMDIKFKVKAENIQISLAHDGTVDILVYNITDIIKQLFKDVPVRPSDAPPMYLEFPIGSSHLSSAFVKFLKDLPITDVTIEINHRVVPATKVPVLDKSLLEMGLS
jgi:CRISPR/Cas system-associated endoribonuclease Cas2